MSRDRLPGDRESEALIERAAALCRDAWGIEGALTPLAAERDLVFRVDSVDGSRFVLKLTDPDEGALATEFQTQALLHLAAHDPSLPVPRLIADRSGRVAFRPDWGLERRPMVRLLSWLEGDLLVGAARTADQAINLGRVMARMGLAFADFEHPGADHHLHWDLRRAGAVRDRLRAVADPGRRRLVERVLDRFDRETGPALERVRRQVVHADVTPYNVLVSRADGNEISGIIDFGDTVRTGLVCDLAVAGSYLVGEGAKPLAIPAALLRGYHGVRPLDAEELALLVPLMETRLAMIVAITEEHAARRPDNRAYITKNTATASRGLEALSRRSLAEWTAALVRDSGLENGDAL